MQCPGTRFPFREIQRGGGEPPAVACGFLPVPPLKFPRGAPSLQHVGGRDTSHSSISALRTPHSAFRNCQPNSASNSVSGRGTNTSLFTAISSPQNEVEPTMCCNGSRYAPAFAPFSAGHPIPAAVSTCAPKWSDTTPCAAASTNAPASARPAGAAIPRLFSPKMQRCVE